ncbi:unnamed protein product [Cunninghamella blakesleeana]
MSLSSQFESTARTGRDNQTYDDKYARRVAGCLPVDNENNRVLLIQSSKYDHVWVIPKGGWENDETVEQAATRETYEEAGVCGNIVSLIGDYMDYDKFGKPKTHFWFYEMDVKEVLDKWPEMRKRQWFTYDEAFHVLRFKPIMQRVLQSSSFARSVSKSS